VLVLLSIAVGLALARPTIAFAQWPPDSITNLQVLPEDIAFRRLVDIMSGFTRALGVRCSFCHVGEEGTPLSRYDFASDDKPTKRKAREMLRMVRAINTQFLAGLEDRLAPPIDVRCVTCHGGVRQPRLLEDIVVLAYRQGGLDTALARYRQLRDEYYGRAAYDFGAVPLTEAAGRIQEVSLSDAVAVLALNVEMNPSSVFAKRSHVQGAVLDAALTGGPDAGVAELDRLRAGYGPAAFPESVVNGLGYALLGRDRTDAAIAVFHKYTQWFPNSANAYDSLGEAYMLAGDTARAIASYERSLELNPNNQNARDKLAELQTP
jgi:tetratricopeptide (TPR) repeat protein